MWSHTTSTAATDHPLMTIRMTIDSMPRVRVDRAQLTQHLISCPGCSGPAAAHIDTREPSRPVLVRVVCHQGCAVNADTVIGQLVDADT